jgi:hypothetical protein
MKIPNLLLSFLTFRIDFEKRAAITVSHAPPFSLNNARIQLESRCLIHDHHTGRSVEYFLGASCKTERVGVERGVWLDPNGDFCPVLSTEEFLDLKSWQQIGIGPYFYPPERGRQQERTFARVADAFDGVTFHIEENEAEVLTTPEAVVRATLDHHLLAGRVEFSAEDHYDVTIDFPIKTMNANERDWIYQTDTGPVLLPDFSQETGSLIETLYLAYVAVNSPDWAEFIVQAPTPLNDEIAVNHYSKPVRLQTRNTIFRLLPAAGRV